MKKKRFEKKLLLNKTTLANLDHEKMRKLHGGVDTVPGARTIEKICAINSCADACTWFPICG